ncbi:unnamed protein product [Amoebophrya sp. A25]|nr:unnamed protein product [Amoebophrya sp. A25]|eukprot:GSA25T00018376001.1
MLEELQDHAASPSDPIGTQVEMSAGASTSVAQEKEEEHDEAFLRLEALVARSYAGYLSGAGRHDLSERPVAAPDGLTAAAPGCLTAAPGGLTAVAPGVPPLMLVSLSISNSMPFVSSS